MASGGRAFPTQQAVMSQLNTSRVSTNLTLAACLQVASNPQGDRSALLLPTFSASYICPSKWLRVGVSTIPSLGCSNLLEQPQHSRKYNYHGMIPHITSDTDEGLHRAATLSPSSPPFRNLLFNSTVALSTPSCLVFMEAPLQRHHHWWTGSQDSTWLVPSFCASVLLQEYGAFPRFIQSLVCAA